MNAFQNRNQAQATHNRIVCAHLSYCIAERFTFDWNGDEDDYEFLE